MRGLILAAGRGSRMGALTRDRPKGLTEIGGRSLISRAIESLRGGGCGEIGIATGYRAELVSPLGDRSFHNARWEQTNMVASLAAADVWLREAPVIVSYSDIFYTRETVAALAGDARAIAITYDPQWRALWEERFGDPLSDAESFRLNGESCLIEIGRKNVGYGDIQGQYMGLIKITPDAWNEIAKTVASLDQARRDKLDVTGLLSLLIARGVSVGAVPCIGVWGECDSESDLRVYQRWLVEGCTI